MLIITDVVGRILICFKHKNGTPSFTAKNMTPFLKFEIFSQTMLFSTLLSSSQEFNENVSQLLILLKQAQ